MTEEQLARICDEYCKYRAKLDVTYAYYQVKLQRSQSSKGLTKYYEKLLKQCEKNMERICNHCPLNEVNNETEN